MLEKFLPRIEFDSYEDFKENYKVNPPSDFNFAYDMLEFIRLLVNIRFMLKV